MLYRLKWRGLFGKNSLIMKRIESKEAKQAEKAVKGLQTMIRKLE